MNHPSSFIDTIAQRAKLARRTPRLHLKEDEDFLALIVEAWPRD